MIPVKDIPQEFRIDWPFAGKYITNSHLSDVEYTWYKNGDNKLDNPHFSVVKKGSDFKQDQGTAYVGAGKVSHSGNSATVKEYALDPSKGRETKIWILRKFHISVPLNSDKGVINGHIFFRVLNAQHVEECGNNLKYLPETVSAAFEAKLALINTWKAFAAGFYEAALKGYRAPNASFLPTTAGPSPPVSVTVGPQVDFYGEQGDDDL